MRLAIIYIVLCIILIGIPLVEYRDTINSVSMEGLVGVLNAFGLVLGAFLAPTSTFLLAVYVDGKLEKKPARLS